MHSHTRPRTSAQNSSGPGWCCASIRCASASSARINSGESLVAASFPIHTCMSPAPGSLTQLDADADIKRPPGFGCEVVPGLVEL